MSNSSEIDLRWMPQDLTNDTSAFGPGNDVMPWGNKPFITWVNVNPELYRHMASLGHNEF